MNRTGYILLALLSVFVASVSQIMLKKSASLTYKNPWQEYLNPRVIIAYGLFFATTLIGLWTYKVIPLSLGAVLESTAYIWVTVLGIVFLKEKVSPMKWVGLALIVLGILVFNA